MKSSNEYLNLKKLVSSYIEKNPPLNKESNRENLLRLNYLKDKLYNQENINEFNSIRNHLVLSNGGFAMKYVMAYVNILNDNSAIEELFQEAIIGIIETIDVFDITKNNSFTTYAYFHIRKRIIDWIKHSKLVRAPRDIARNMKHVADIQDYIHVNYGIIPNAYDIKDELKKVKGINLKLSLIESIMILLNLNSANEGDTFICEYIDNPTDSEDMDIITNMECNILNTLKLLPTKLQELIILRYGIGKEFPHSLDEIKVLLTLTDKEIKELEQLI